MSKYPQDGGSICWFYDYCVDRGIRGIFFRGGKVTFSDFFFHGVKCFFPVENFHFDRPKTNFSHSEKWKAKKKKKKRKKSLLPIFLLFLLPFPILPFLFQFSFFSPSFCSSFPFFSLASHFLVGQQKFPCQKSRGGVWWVLCPACPPTCYEAVHWCETAELHGAFPLAGDQVRNVWHMSCWTWVPTRWLPREKGWQPLLVISIMFS